MSLHKQFTKRCKTSWWKQ